MFDLNYEIELTFLQNKGYLKEEYVDQFLQAMNNDSCLLMQEIVTPNTSLSHYFDNITKCESFISGST